MALEVAAGALCGLAVLSGEYGDGVVRGVGMLQRHTDTGTHLACGAAADGVHHDHRSSWLSEGFIDFFGGARFGKAGLGELLAHGDNHQFGVHSEISCLYDCTRSAREALSVG